MVPLLEGVISERVMASLLEGLIISAHMSWRPFWNEYFVHTFHGVPSGTSSAHVSWRLLEGLYWLVPQVSNRSKIIVRWRYKR
ncbi:hypothetical protein FKM82_018460 [Ascaphus truei]